MNPNVQQVEQTTVAGHSGKEDAKVVALLKTRKHVPLPFHLIDEFGMIGCSDKNGDKLREYFRKAFPASTVTQAILTAPYIIVICTKIPSGPLPFTVGGLPITFATKYTDDLRYKLGTPAKKRKHIVTSLNFHNKDKVTDEAIWTIAGELQQLHLRPTEIGFMRGACRLAFPHSVDPTDIPYRIAGCPVYVQFHSATATRLKTPIGTNTDTNNYLEHADRTLRPGVMFSSSLDGNEQYLSTSSGLLVEDAQGNRYVTCALHGFRPDGIVFHPDPIRGRQIGKVVQEFSRIDVGLVRLEPGISYTNEFFESKEGGASGLIPRAFADADSTKNYCTLEMDNPFNGSCAGTIIGLNSIFDGVKYQKHELVIFEHGTGAHDGCCGSPIVDENGWVTAMFRFVDITRTGVGFALPAAEVEKLGLKLVDSHVF